MYTFSSDHTYYHEYFGKQQLKLKIFFLITLRDLLIIRTRINSASNQKLAFDLQKCGIGYIFKKKIKNIMRMSAFSVLDLINSIYISFIIPNFLPLLWSNF